LASTNNFIAIEISLWLTPVKILHSLTLLLKCNAGAVVVNVLMHLSAVISYHVRS